MFFRQKPTNPLNSLLTFFQQHPKFALVIASIGFGLALYSYSHASKTKSITMSEEERKLTPDTATPVLDVPGLQKALAPEKWPLNHPVPIDDLVYIKLTYYGFDKKEHVGALIMHKDVADDILYIFSELLKAKFPIEEITPIHYYGNNDDDSMGRDNTSAFNCRMITGTTDRFSEHSYGRAVDINPVINPYIKGTTILPPNGKKFVDRNIPTPGKITKDSLPYRLFTKRGWTWGGDWNDLKDYQHFEKRPPGRSRPS